MMKTIYRLVVLSVLFNFYILSTWAGDTWRCKQGKLVSVGNTMNEVVERCGEPDMINAPVLNQSPLSLQRSSHKEIVEWLYKTTEIPYYILKFENENLKSIESHYNY